MSDSLFYWTFYANSGDQYSGYTWDDSVDFFAGQYINSIYGQGYYYVSNEYEYGYDLSSYSGSSYNEGTTHVYAYYDSATGAVYTPYYYSLGYASTTSGIGSEYDYVYKSGIYNDFGVGGYYQA
jgi:hypothetical protein